MAEIHVFEEFPLRVKVDEVFAQLCDFESWKYWMPWFVSDPTAKMEVSKDKTVVKWKGRVIGEGELKRVTLIENSIMEFEVSITQPKPIKAKVVLTFVQNSELFYNYMSCKYKNWI